MLTKTSKVHELFVGMNSVLKHKKDFEKYAAILRDMINEHVVSGKMTLDLFFDKETSGKWLKYVESVHGEGIANEMYSILMDIPKDFVVVEHDAAGPSATPTKKQEWTQIMLPLAKAFATKDVTPEALLNVLWETLECNNEDVQCFFNMGKIIYTKLM